MIAVSLLRPLRRPACSRPRAVDPPSAAGPAALDGRLFAPVLLLGAVLATVAMERALVTHDFSLVYVADNNARATPLLYSITGLWSALAGSILLWGLALAVFTGLLVWRYRRQGADPVVRWATLVMYAVSAFFFGLMAGPANPFLTVPGTAPLHGAGPNALLQDNPLVAIHPPLLYLGFVGFTVPVRVRHRHAGHRPGRRAAGRPRPGAGPCWRGRSCRSGIVLGAWWSYQVLGWGGFWGWDPVENAALMPWLCGTAYLHSVLVQERRGLLRVWNLSLSIATFALTILGTFLTRSGVIQSVHAFSESDLGPLLHRLLPRRGGRRLRPHRLAGRPAALARAASTRRSAGRARSSSTTCSSSASPSSCCSARSSRSSTRRSRTRQVTVGAPYFDTVAVPVGLALLLLMAVAPALSWRKVDGAVLWHRLALPAWFGVLVVVGCVIGGVRGFEPLLAFGLGAFAAASAVRSLVLSVADEPAPRRRASGGAWSVGPTAAWWSTSAWSSSPSGWWPPPRSGPQRELALAQGQVVHYDGHTFVFEGLRTVRTPQRSATEAVIRVDGGGLFYPAVSKYDGPTPRRSGRRPSTRASSTTST